MDKIEIINYTSAQKNYVKNLNEAWLNKYFEVEPIDAKILADPDGEIIAKGGMIFFATLNNEIVGTVTLYKVSDTYFELSKMAVTEAAQGLGIGNMLIAHCIKIAKENDISTLFLYSNTILEPAIKLYKKFGFMEVPLTNKVHERANIKMELIL